MKHGLILFTLMILSSHGFSAMQTETVLYKDGDLNLKGTVLFDDAYEGKRAGILVLPEKWGVNDFAILRAEMLAETGYVAFIADMYGEAKNTRKLEEANQWEKTLTENSDAWLNRSKLALDQLLALKNVDKGNIALLGLNMGGISAIKLAQVNTNIKGTAMIHAPINKYINAEILTGLSSSLLVLQGGADSAASFSSMAKFAENLNDQETPWEMVVYGGAMQSFSDPYADSYGLENVGFNEDAEKKSWDRVLLFFESLFEEELIL